MPNVYDKNMTRVHMVSLLNLRRLIGLSSKLLEFFLNAICNKWYEVVNLG